MSVQAQKLNQTAHDLGQQQKDVDQKLNDGQKNIDKTIQSVGQVGSLSRLIAPHAACVFMVSPACPLGLWEELCSYIASALAAESLWLGKV